MHCTSTLRTKLVYVKQSSIPKAGLGLFAARDIEVDEEQPRNFNFILLTRLKIQREAVVSDMDSKRECIEIKTSTGRRVFYCTDNCKNRGFLGCYINDTPPGMTPNCAIRVLKNNRPPAVGIVLLGDVKKDEELFCDYGDLYPKHWLV